MIRSLDVMLWGRKVGTLVSVPKGHRSRICFYFDPQYVAQGLDFAPLRASISGIQARQGLPVYPEEERLFGGLPSFIADSMPDRWGNLVFDEWARNCNIRKRDISVLNRLAYLGRRGMGALEFMPPAADGMEIPFKVEIARLSDLAHTAISSAERFHITLSPSLSIESLFKVGTSAGGRRPKAVINLNTSTGECYSGQVNAPEPGFTPMIIKFDEHSDVPSTRIEYSYYLMAVAAGLRMMPSRMLECGGRTHFLTERFDRHDGEKIHVQTLAAMNPAASSYEELFETARRLGVGPERMHQLFIHMTLNVMGGNVDDHSKNFSFTMDRYGRWDVAPAYDFTFTVDPSAPSYINRHSLTVNGSDQDLTAADLLAVAAKYDIRSADATLRHVAAIVSRYREFGEQAGVAEQWIRMIEAEISALRL